MTTSIDTNVFIALWDKELEVNHTAERGLEAALESGPLIVCAPVYSELLANRGRSESFLDEFFISVGIRVDWQISESIWRAAGRAFARHAEQRKRHSYEGPRRILADFIIAAHAAHHRYRLITLDSHLDASFFPGLTVTKI